MGDIADMMLDGILDQYTGEYIGPGVGYPRSINHGKRFTNPQKCHDPRRGIVSFIERYSLGKKYRPQALDLIKEYCILAGWEFTSRAEAENKISMDFFPFSIFVKRKCGLWPIFNKKNQKKYPFLLKLYEQ